MRPIQRWLSVVVVLGLGLAAAPSYSLGGELQDGNSGSRATWSGGLGLRLGSSWMTADNDVSAGGSLAVDLDVHVARGLNENVLLVMGVGRFAAWYPDATSGDLRMTTYTLAATYFPFERAGLFASLGGGYVKTDNSMVVELPHERPFNANGIDGYLLRGELGYEWRIGETFGLGLEFRTERLQFGDDIDEIWTFVGGTNLRWYM